MAKQLDLIAAQATPETVSAIAVVRLSGRGASKTVEEAMNLNPGRLDGMRRAVGNFAGLDKLVALSWPAGKSYTGEEMVDLMCHGTHGTADSILKTLLAAGARQAEPGEFTRRAWLNGKLTSTDVLLLSARFRNISVSETNSLQKKLEELLIETEALIEFGEEHETAEEERVIMLLDDAGSTAEELRESVKRIEILPRSYIMGPVNSGKSTLFNRLIGEKAAVVSDIPGTTRDGAERSVIIRGRTVHIIDTAGTGGDHLDSDALEIALSGMQKGDRIVWMDPLQEEPPEAIVRNLTVFKVASMRDIGGDQVREGWTPLSSLSGRGISEVEEFISSPDNGCPSWLLEKSVESIKLAAEMCRSSDLALGAEIMKQVLQDLNSDLKNGEAVERALEVFCVGK